MQVAWEIPSQDTSQVSTGWPEQRLYGLHLSQDSGDSLAQFSGQRGLALMLVTKLEVVDHAHTSHEDRKPPPR